MVLVTLRSVGAQTMRQNPSFASASVLGSMPTVTFTVGCGFDVVIFIISVLEVRPDESVTVKTYARRPFVHAVESKSIDPEVMPVLFVQHPVIALKVSYLRPDKTFVVIGLASFVRHHLETTAVPLGAADETALIVKTPDFVVLLVVAQVTVGPVLVLLTVNVLLVAARVDESVTVNTKVCDPSAHAVESKSIDPEVMPVLFVQHPVIALKVSYLRPDKTFVVIGLASFVRHHLETTAGDVVACAELAEIVNVPLTFISLRVLHATPGEVLVPDAEAGVVTLESVRVVLVAVLLVVSVIVRTKV